MPSTSISRGARARPAPRRGAARVAAWGAAACGVLGLWWAFAAKPPETPRAHAAAHAAEAAVPSANGGDGSAPGTAPGAFPWAAVCGGRECAPPPPAGQAQAQAQQPVEQPPSLPTLAVQAPLPWAADPDAWALHPQAVAPVASFERPRFNTPSTPDEFDPAPGIDSDLDADTPATAAEEQPAG